MAKVKTGGTTGRKKYHLTNRSSRSVGEELIDTGFGKIGEVAIKGTFNMVTGRGRSLWGRQLDKIRHNAATAWSGHRRDSKGNLNPDDAGISPYGFRANMSRVGAALSIPFNVAGAAIAAPISASTAIAKTAVTAPIKGAAYVAKKSARPAARFLGAATYETARVGGQILNGGAKTMRAPGVTDLAMAGTFVGVTGIGLGLAINEIGGGNRDFNGHASGLTGTTGMSPTPMVNTGANGDLVLAMHKLR